MTFAPRAATGSSPSAAPACSTDPAAFTTATGADHWEVLLRARAIEKAVFVLAPGQVGKAPAALRLLGRSAIGRPLGRGARDRPDEECFVAADLDLAAAGARPRVAPGARERRPQSYAWPEPPGSANSTGATH